MKQDTGGLPELSTQRPWPWRETYGVAALAAGGWGGLLWWLGLRPIVGIGGAIATVVTLAWWVREVRSLPEPEASANLLEEPVLAATLARLAQQTSINRTGTVWRTIAPECETARAAAVAIGERETSLLPDLYEALQTVVGLAERAAKATIAAEQVQTARYRDLARQQQREALDRLQASRRDLVELRDSLLVGDINAVAPQLELPARLSLVVESNRAALQAIDAASPASP